MEIQRRQPDEQRGMKKIQEMMDAMIPPKAEAEIKAEVEEAMPPKPRASVLELAEDADAEVLKFAETMKERRTRPAERAYPAGSLDEMAMRFFKIAFGIEPAWEERDNELQAEWTLTPAQRLIKCIAIVYDQQLHMNMPHGYEFTDFEAQPAQSDRMNLATKMEAECPQCHKTFTRKVPGQVTCSNACGDAYFPPPERKEVHYDDFFERFIESQNQRTQPAVDSIRNIGTPAPGVLR